MLTNIPWFVAFIDSDSRGIMVDSVPTRKIHILRIVCVTITLLWTSLERSIYSTGKYNTCLMGAQFIEAYKPFYHTHMHTPREIHVVLLKNNVALLASLGVFFFFETNLQQARIVPFSKGLK